MKAPSGSHQIRSNLIYYILETVGHVRFGEELQSFDGGRKESMMAPLVRNRMLRNKELSSEPPLQDINFRV